MSRMTIRLDGNNVELVNFTFEKVEEWIKNPQPEHFVTEAIEVAIDEAYNQIAEGSSNLEYVIIKITK